MQNLSASIAKQFVKISQRNERVREQLTSMSVLHPHAWTTFLSLPEFSFNLPAQSFQESWYYYGRQYLYHYTSFEVCQQYFWREQFFIDIMIGNWEKFDPENVIFLTYNGKRSAEFTEAYENNFRQEIKYNLKQTNIWIKVSNANVTFGDLAHFSDIMKS